MAFQVRGVRCVVNIKRNCVIFICECAKLVLPGKLVGKASKVWVRRNHQLADKNEFEVLTEAASLAASLCWWRPWGRSPSFLRVGISTTVPKVNHLYVHNRIGIGTTVPKVARNEKLPCREVRKRNISHQFRHSMHYCASTWLQSSLPTNRTTTPLMKSDVLSDTTYSPF